MPDLRDAIGLVAVGLISYGAYTAYPPAGFVAGGALLLTGALLSGRVAATRDRRGADTPAGGDDTVRRR